MTSILLALASLFACERVELPVEIDSIDFQLVGTLLTRSTKDIESSSWSIGGETLDRGYADYNNYKDYLDDLGAKRIRLQAGWARIEKKPGEYDWDWLDEIIDDALNREIKPWLNLSYGNPIYPGGGRATLGSDLPSSTTALEAWDKWVANLILRYGDRIDEWEVWNEPDSKTNDPTEYTFFYIRTAKIIQSIQPDAKLYAIASARLDPEYFTSFLKILENNSSLNLVTAITYHGYPEIPESIYPRVVRLQGVVDSFSDNIFLFQGECGAPSKNGTFGALNDIEWNELSQAKWNLRRMISDYGREIPTSIFSIIDMKYNSSWNYKGIIEANQEKKAVRPKLAYSAMQHVTSIFDSSIVPFYEYDFHFNYKYSISTYVFKSVRDKTYIVAFWYDGERPEKSNRYKITDFTVSDVFFNNPVLVDLISGNIYAIPRSKWDCSMDNKVCNFSDIPVLDSPHLIMDKIDNEN